jgi:hypothetical protein
VDIRRSWVCKTAPKALGARLPPGPHNSGETSQACLRRAQNPPTDDTGGSAGVTRSLRLSGSRALQNERAQTESSSTHSASVIVCSTFGPLSDRGGAQISNQLQLGKLEAYVVGLTGLWSSIHGAADSVREEIGAARADIDELNSGSELDQMTSLRLQMMMDRRSSFLDSLSNLLKKIQDTEASIAQNLK